MQQLRCFSFLIFVSSIVLSSQGMIKASEGGERAVEHLIQENKILREKVGAYERVGYSFSRGRVTHCQPRLGLWGWTKRLGKIGILCTGTYYIYVLNLFGIQEKTAKWAESGFDLFVDCKEKATKEYLPKAVVFFASLLFSEGAEKKNKKISHIVLEQENQENIEGEIGVLADNTEHINVQQEIEETDINLKQYSDGKLKA
ncbi:hypothetical protein KC460_04235 [Candidatus Dependentiae bacterium]|nr:hypothetical protein [Candidatus Dependentiae bacterium]